MCIRDRFIAAAVIVGGRTGAKSLVALAVTLVCLFGVLLPALMKGANTLLMTFIVCAYVAVSYTHLYLRSRA